MRWLLVVGLAVGLLGYGAWRLNSASGAGATLSMSGAPASVAAGGPAFSVSISVAGVTNLAAYEWQLAFDPNVVAFESATDGSFLGSTGRAVSCALPPAADLEPGNVLFGCETTGSASGPNGSGLLSSARFQVVAGGAPDIHLVCAGPADPLGEPIDVSNLPVCGSSVTPTPGPGETPGPGDTPVPTSTPGGPAETPAPGATPTPAGPLPTPTPLPPGLEAVPLVAGCSPVASTYADATPIETIAGAVGPEGNLVSLWMFESGTWRAFSPQFPEVSNLTEVGFLDVAFVCAGGPGAFVRPVV